MTKTLHSFLRQKQNFSYSLLFFFICFFASAQTTKVDELLPKLKEKIADTARLRVFKDLAAAYSSVDQNKKYYYAQQCKFLAEKLKVDTLVVEALIDMGATHAVQSRMDSALHYFGKGRDQAKSIKYDQGLARSFASIGYVYDKLDKRSESIVLYKDALQLYKKIKHKKGINQCLINIGGIYYDLAEYKLAESYFMQSYLSNKEIGNELGIGSSLFSLAGANKRLGNQEKAFQYYQESLQIRERIGDKNGIALTRWGIGNIYNEKEAYKKALENFEIALKINEEINNKYQASAVNLSIATSHLGLNDYDLAYKFTQKAYQESKNIDSKNLRLEALKVYIKITQKQENFKKAFDYQSHYLALLDSVETEKTSKQVMLTEFNRVQSENKNLVKDNKLFATQNDSYLTTIGVTSALLLLFVVLLFALLLRYKEKQKMNTLLEKQKQEIANINSELAALNEEVVVQMELTASQNIELEQLNHVKNKFFSIVSHDLRSPLGNLKMLFTLYREGQLNETELSILLSKIEETIYMTGAFLDNLLEWSKSQLDGIQVKPSNFKINKVITENLQMMDNSIRMKELKIENIIPDDLEVFADANMIHVVIRNLISNGIKFCNNGDSIHLKAEQIDDRIFISIKDTGPGISQNNLENIFSLEYTVSTGTSGEKGHHIGLILCKDMMEQNNGSIKVESQLGEGTTFHLQFPAGK